MIIDLFSQSYNPQFVFSSSDISYLFSDRKDLSYSRIPGKSSMQCLRVSLHFFLLCCIPFPLGFLNHPVRSGCCGCRQFPFSSIVHQIDYFFPSIVPDKTSLHILSVPVSLHPIGLELIRSEYTLLTWPSALHPKTCLSRNAR